MRHLQNTIKNNLLIDDYSGVKFIAWNANKFDAYFVAAAIVTDPTYIIRPYLTRSKALRGMRIMLSEFFGEDGEYPKDAPHWEFLDGMAMLGLVAVKLSKFLENFAPNFRKLDDVIDFDYQEFDCDSPEHRAYAMRDSEGLYHGMINAQNIMLERFNQPLTATMGGTCIKIFQANIPKSTEIHALDSEVEAIVRNYVLRGGYCHCVRPYMGPVWKYDLNQAYAAAMREADLPAGNAIHTANGLNRYAQVYIARVTCYSKNNKIPFYVKQNFNGRVKATFQLNEIVDTWLTSIEVEQLKREGWKITIHESWFFTDKFSMREYIDKLETMRMSCAGGPSGPIGTMIKGVGNHSYGKTLEAQVSINYLMSADQPPGYAPLYSDGEMEPLDNLYYQTIDPEDVREKAYHQPHVGAFITAHVRVVLRRAALLSPDTWLYADTDCNVFSSDVTDKLDIHPSRYGAWKVEDAGVDYQIIAKKVYINISEGINAETLEDVDTWYTSYTDGEGHSKGLNVKKLTPLDFDNWYQGNAPVQQQVQRNNFLSVMRGAEMFKAQQRSGTRVNAR